MTEKDAEVTRLATEVEPSVAGAGTSSPTTTPIATRWCPRRTRQRRR